MLNAAVIRSNISGQEVTYTSCAVSVERRGSGAVLLSVTPLQYHHHHHREDDDDDEGELPRTIALVAERLVSLTADMLRRKWYLHVGMASGRVDIAVDTRKEQTQWFILLRPNMTPSSGKTAHSHTPSAYLRTHTLPGAESTLFASPAGGIHLAAVARVFIRHILESTPAVRELRPASVHLSYDDAHCRLHIQKHGGDEEEVIDLVAPRLYLQSQELFGRYSVVVKTGHLAIELRVSNRHEVGVLMSMLKPRCQGEM